MTDMLFPATTPNRDFALTNKLVYSFPKTGKTTLLSFMRDADGRPPLFAQSEKGEGVLKIHRGHCSSWDGFLKFIAHVETNRARVQAEHSSIIVDVVSDFDDMCVAHVCEQNKIRALADLEYGKGQYLHKKAFKEAMFRLMAILPVSYIAHAGEREIIWNGEKVKIQSPIMSKNALEFVNGKVDTIMFILPATMKREYPEIIVENTMTCISGSRYPQLVGRYRFDPRNPEKAMRDIEAAFARGDTAAPASAEEIATIASIATEGTQPAVPQP